MRSLRQVIAASCACLKKVSPSRARELSRSSRTSHGTCRGRTSRKRIRASPPSSPRMSRGSPGTIGTRDNPRRDRAGCPESPLPADPRTRSSVKVFCTCHIVQCFLCESECTRLPARTRTPSTTERQSLRARHKRPIFEVFLHMALQSPQDACPPFEQPATSQGRHRGGTARDAYIRCLITPLST